jgi:hypothetical protein
MPAKMIVKFEDLITVLKKFRLICAPCRESEIETALIMFLNAHKIPAKRQFTIPSGRLDIMVGSYIIEVKMTGSKSIAGQLDKYSGYCEGLIVVCWKASQPLKAIFAVEKQTAKIPVELIEVRNACGMI